MIVWTKEFIWKFDGQQLLIATEYMSGSHEARITGGFLPIMDELTKLHQNGMVHGDICVFNMVFFPADDAGKPQGYLFDFDFGGTDGKAKYPSGYW